MTEILSHASMADVPAGTLSPLVPRLYSEIIRKEQASVGGDGPLSRIMLPQGDRRQLRFFGEKTEFVEDRENMPYPGLPIIRKYRDRIAVMITDRCAGHCMYCFRQDMLSDPAAERLQAQVIARGLAQILEEDGDITEVILTGGDPMTVSDEVLETVVDPIRDAHRDIRIHTRNLVFAPRTFSPRKVDIISGANIRLMHHIVHPYELHAGARSTLRELNAAGIRSYSQFPIIRGVNDDARLLAAHLRLLDVLGIRPATLFVIEPVNYSAEYRVSLKRLFDIKDTINRTTPGWLNAVRLVLDTPVGKVRQNHIISWDEDSREVLFEREGRRVQYIDVPGEMDVPGELSKMLWAHDVRRPIYPQILSELP